MREAARQRLVSLDRAASLRSRGELDAFFAACDRRETGREPDWEEHRVVIEESMRKGATDS